MIAEVVRGFHPSPLLSANNSHAKLPQTRRMHPINRTPTAMSSLSCSVSSSSSGGLLSNGSGLLSSITSTCLTSNQELIHGTLFGMNLLEWSIGQNLSKRL